LLYWADVDQSAEWDDALVHVIVPYNYQRTDRTYFNDLQFGPGPDHQSWIDTPKFREDVPPLAHNL